MKTLSEYKDFALELVKVANAQDDFQIMDKLASASLSILELHDALTIAKEALDSYADFERKDWGMGGLADKILDAIEKVGEK